VNTINSTIRQLHRNGLTVAEIRERLKVTPKKVHTALRAARLHQPDSEDLRGVPALPDEVVRRLEKYTQPEDEPSTTQAVYQAAEEIRNRRPRKPVGCEEKHVEVTHASAVFYTERGLVPL
jgi:hypothetical protein